jgi:hypothetical protein
MNLNVLEKYVNLCGVLSIKPSWEGLNEYYNHNTNFKFKNSFYRKNITKHARNY